MVMLGWQDKYYMLQKGVGMIVGEMVLIIDCERYQSYLDFIRQLDFGFFEKDKLIGKDMYKQNIFRYFFCKGFKFYCELRYIYKIVVIGDILLVLNVCYEFFGVRNMKKYF